MNLKLPKLTTQRLTTLAILVALALIVSKFSLSIIPKQLSVSFTFIVHAVIGMVGGPIWALISLAVVDVVDILTQGGDFNPLWTIMEAAQGFFYGYFFFGKSLSWNKIKDWGHVTLAVVVVMLIGTFIFTPLLIQMMYGTSFIAQYVAGRWLKIFEIPIRVLILMFILPQLQRIPELRKLAEIKK